MLCSVFSIPCSGSLAIAALQSRYIVFYLLQSCAEASSDAYIHVSSFLLHSSIPAAKFQGAESFPVHWKRWIQINTWLPGVPNLFALCKVFSKAKRCFTAWPKAFNASEAGLTASHWVFSLSEVNQSSGFQREQMNAVSTWQAPPCDEDWETGEELPNLPHCCRLPGPVLQLHLGQCESRDAVRLGLTCRTPCLCAFLKMCTSPPSRLFLV